MSEPNPIAEWNRLHKQNAQNAMVGAMLESVISCGPAIDKFATWLLVGAAAIGSYMLTNSDKIIPMFGQSGFAWSGVFLFASCIFGLVEKYLSMLAEASSASRKLQEKKLRPIIDSFFKPATRLSNPLRRRGSRWKLISKSILFSTNF